MQSKLRQLLRVVSPHLPVVNKFLCFDRALEKGISRQGVSCRSSWGCPFRARTYFKKGRAWEHGPGTLCKLPFSHSLSGCNSCWEKETIHHPAAVRTFSFGGKKVYTKGVFSSENSSASTGKRRGLVYTKELVFKGKRRKIHIHQRAFKVFMGDSFTQYWCIDFGLLFFAAKRNRGPQRKDFGCRYGFPGFYMVFCILHWPEGVLFEGRHIVQKFLSLVVTYAFFFPELLRVVPPPSGCQ